ASDRSLRIVDSPAVQSSSCRRHRNPRNLENTMDTSQPFISAIATIGIPVTDQDHALEFYTETLGMEKQLDVPLPQMGGRWITIAPTGGATTIALLRGHVGGPAGG